MAKLPPRYCGLCDVWVAARHLECPECGAPTDKPLRRVPADPPPPRPAGDAA